MSNFKVTWDKKTSILTQIWYFWTVNLVWIYWWLSNDAQSLKQNRRGALLFFKVIRQISRSHGTKNRLFLTPIERFRTVASDWIHRWIWNNTQSLMWCGRCALSFFEVIHQISRSHGLKNWWFRSNLITRPVAAIKSFRFALFPFGHQSKCTCVMFPEQMHSQHYTLTLTECTLQLGVYTPKPLCYHSHRSVHSNHTPNIIGVH